ncbi:MAG: hypothetical protein PHV39_05650 [Methanomicrobium sp.]|nr:hypothetical protein [Methanomicrobium sp.]
MKNMMLVFILLMISCSFTACTENSQNLAEFTPKTNIPNDTVTETEPIFSNELTQNVSNQTDVSLSLEKLKDRITSVFPKVISDSISDPEYVSSPKKYYSYKNVKTTDGMRYEIRIEPDTGDISTYVPTSSMIYKKADKNVSFDDAKEISAEFLEKLRNNSSEKYLDSYQNNSALNIYYVGEDQDIAYGICVDYRRLINGIYCMDSIIQTEIDSITGEVTLYHESWPDYDKYKFSSSEPDFSLEDAKKSVESKIEENYPGEVKNYDYIPRFFTEDSKLIEPVWYDSYNGIKRLVSDTNRTVDLVWAFYYEPELNEGFMHGGQSVYSATISAHTGEIYNLRYKDFYISM